MYKAFAVATVLSLSICFSANAQSGAALPQTDATTYDFPECHDSQGEKVNYFYEGEVYNKHTIYIAGARYLNETPLSQPAIFYAPQYFDQMSQIERDFSFAHECHHLESGDALYNYVYYRDTGRDLPPKEKRRIEDNADRAAAIKLYQLGYKEGQLSILKKLFRTASYEKSESRYEYVLKSFLAAKDQTIKAALN